MSQPSPGPAPDERITVVIRRIPREADARRKLGEALVRWQKETVGSRICHGVDRLLEGEMPRTHASDLMISVFCRRDGKDDERNYMPVVVVSVPLALADTLKNCVSGFGVGLVDLDSYSAMTR